MLSTEHTDTKINAKEIDKHKVQTYVIHTNSVIVF